MNKRYFKVEDNALTLHIQFIIDHKMSKASYVDVYTHELEKSKYKLKAMCKEVGLVYEGLCLYREQVLDRRSLKHIPKGCKVYRFSYTPYFNTVGCV